MNTPSSGRGFTLIELMIVVAVIAILAAIAFPSYQNYIKKGNANTAAADLAALASSLENHFQRTLAYPASMNGTANITATIKTWNPASKASLFDFSYEAGADYSLKASGKALMAGCNLSLSQSNMRTGGGSACGGFSW